MQAHSTLGFRTRMARCRGSGEGGIPHPRSMAFVMPTRKDVPPLLGRCTNMNGLRTVGMHGEGVNGPSPGAGSGTRS
jgi:hypothetical protein